MRASNSGEVLDGNSWVCGRVPGSTVGEGVGFARGERLGEVVGASCADFAGPPGVDGVACGDPPLQPAVAMTASARDKATDRRRGMP